MLKVLDFPESSTERQAGVSQPRRNPLVSGRNQAGGIEMTRPTLPYSKTSTQRKRGTGSNRSAPLGIDDQSEVQRVKCRNFPRFCPAGFVDSGYRGMGSLTELTEVSGTGMEVLQNSPQFGASSKLIEAPGGYVNIVPVPVPAPQYFTNCRIPGIYLALYPIIRVFILPKGRVRVW